MMAMVGGVILLVLFGSMVKDEPKSAALLLAVVTVGILIHFAVS